MWTRTRNRNCTSPKYPLILSAKKRKNTVMLLPKYINHLQITTTKSVILKTVRHVYPAIPPYFRFWSMIYDLKIYPERPFAINHKTQRSPVPDGPSLLNSSKRANMSRRFHFSADVIVDTSSNMRLYTAFAMHLVGICPNIT